MESKEDKAKKLKEIQDRLSEIQSESAKITKLRKTETEASESKSPSKITAEIPKPDVQPKRKEATPEKTGTPLTTPSSRSNDKTVEKPLTEQPWADNKPRANDPSQASGKNEVIQPAQKSTFMKVVPVVSFLITLLVIGYFGSSYFLSTSPTSAPKAENQTEHSEAPMDKQTNVQGIVKNEESADIQPSPTPVTPGAKSNSGDDLFERSEPSARATSLAKVPGGFIISYASNSSREAAEKNVASLRQQGFNANYYFMPDQKKENPALYKVYVGPYDSESAAFPDFRNIIKLNDKAFILRMDRVK